MTNKEREDLLKDILNIIPLNPRGRFLLAPRFGKTKLGINIIKLNKPKSILWVTPLSSLAEIDIPREFEVWKAKSYLNKLQTVTWTSLSKIQGEFDMIILDEEQFATENNLSTLLNGTLKAKSLISMTGTESRHETKQELYLRLGLKPLYEMDINAAVDAGILSNYDIKVILAPLNTAKNMKAGSKNFSFITSEDKNYEYLNNQFKDAMNQNRKDLGFKMLNRMRAIYNSPTKTYIAKRFNEELKGRKLFFCSSVKQAEAISSFTYHNKTDGKHFRDFINGDLNEIAMVNKGGTGATYKSIDHLILVQSDSDKNGLTAQKISRTLLQQLDYKATIWIICLVGTQDEKWIKAALERFDQSKVEYIDYNKLPFKIELPGADLELLKTIPKTSKQIIVGKKIVNL